MMLQTMPLTFDQVLEGLATLRAEDFDFNRLEANGPQRLNSLTDELLAQPNPKRAIPHLFRMMERLPDADLGSPGPLVHTLEELKDYETELAISVRRAPCALSVWMINRILNVTSNAEQRVAWLAGLESVLSNPLANEQIKRDAANFLKFQRGRQSQ